MARRLKKADKKILEELTLECLQRAGSTNASKEEAALLIRFLMSSIANYFFNSPDDFIDVGFLRFKKNPIKEELFAVELIKDEVTGVVNAETLYRYYKGDLNIERDMKEAVNNFVTELLTYSQRQNEDITNLTGKLSKRRNRDGF